MGHFLDMESFSFSTRGLPLIVWEVLFMQFEKKKHPKPKSFLGLDRLNFVWNKNDFSLISLDILEKTTYVSLGWQDKG